MKIFINIIIYKNYKIVFNFFKKYKLKINERIERVSNFKILI